MTSMSMSDIVDEHRLTNYQLIKDLKTSIAEKGLTVPISARETVFGYKIVDGYHRYQACKELGYSRIGVQIIKLADLMIDIMKIHFAHVGLRCVETQCAEYRTLKSSIHQFGLEQPITVRLKDGRYEIIDGQHRYQACQELHHTEIFASVIHASDFEMLCEQVRLNRKSNVTNDALAIGLKRILTHQPTITLDQLDSKTQLGTGRIKQLLGLEKIVIGHELINRGDICLSNAYSLAKLPHNEQLEWLDRAASMSAVDFMPLVSERLRELKKARIYQSLRPALSSWELLHGPKKVLPTPVPVIKEPVLRQGWDNVGDGYCRGDVLVSYTGKCWAPYHPVMPAISNMSFNTVLEAMVFVENHLKVE